MGQPSDEPPQEESPQFPTAHGPQEVGTAQEQPSPSWTAYLRPLAAVRDAHGPHRHPRYWEAELEAARRGSLAWGFAAFFLGYGGFYVLGLVFSGALPPRGAGFDPAHPPVLGPMLLLAFAPNIVLGLVPAVFSWWKGRGVRSDFGIVPTRRDVKVGLTCGVSALGASLLLAALLVRINGLPSEERISELTHGPKSIWLLLFALFAFLGAPVTEELLMRGALWGALEHYRVPRGVILTLTALVFALIHQEMWRLPILFVGGIAIGTARMITGRIGASIIAHATNNFLPALVLFATAS